MKDGLRVSEIKYNKDFKPYRTVEWDISPELIQDLDSFSTPTKFKEEIGGILIDEIVNIIKNKKEYGKKRNN